MSPLYIIIALEFVYIIFLTIHHGAERKDLYNRIMAKDSADYQKLSGSRPSKGGNFIKNSIIRKAKSREEV